MAVDAVRFAVRLTPDRWLNRVEGVVDGTLKVRVMAPAVEGAANNALVRVLADALDIPRRDVRIIAGAGQPPEAGRHRWRARRGRRRPMARPQGLSLVAETATAVRARRRAGPIDFARWTDPGSDQEGEMAEGPDAPAPSPGAPAAGAVPAAR